MKSPERLKSDYMVKCAKMGIDTIPEIREQLRKDITEIKVKLPAKNLMTPKPFTHMMLMGM